MASIIPFPVRPTSAEPESLERLVRALASMDAALADQRVCVAKGYKKLSELDEIRTTLFDDLQLHQTNLRLLEDGVSLLRNKARLLADQLTQLPPDAAPAYLG
jgi:hypothetical protein